MFSGKMPDWMVQIPAASVDAINACEQCPADAFAAVVGVHVDGVLDHPGVDGPRGDG